MTTYSYLRKKIGELEITTKERKQCGLSVYPYMYYSVINIRYKGLS